MDVADQQVGRGQVKDAVAEECQRLFQAFLETCKTENGNVKYLEEARNLIRPERNTLKVSYEDIENMNPNLAKLITEEFYRVYPFLCIALKNFLKDNVDVNVPKKEFFVSLKDVPSRINIRELSTVKVGTLVRISGQVVRSHPVHPELVQGTFTCLDCNSVIKGVEQQFKYTQPTICPNNICNNRSRFLLDTNKSRFVDFQKFRIQETQRELPRGAIPRSLEVVVRAELVESAQPGDKCDFTGCLIVVPDVGALSLPGVRAEMGRKSRPEGMEGQPGEGLQGLKALGVRDLNYRTAFLACGITSSNPKYAGHEWNLEDATPETLRAHLNDSEWKKIFEMSNDRSLYKNLYNSLFPTIHGSDEIKRGILLMLFGGVPKKTGEGTTLRGDINICIVGDPSTAKSQFLKQVTEFSPRSVYTSGKASSAAGLTAAVVRDEESFEFVIEAGALMLADNGICCIDEFDKMDKHDQVAIHEAMEQQTISITKAGVKATLNARTSILAAANPIEGRYNRGKSLKQNVGLSAPIMSRFDLFFILIDEPNEITDYAVARKIVDLHALKEESVERVYSPEEILRYITFARQFKPRIGKEAARQIVIYYNHLRQRENVGGTSTRITVRQLESMIRLAEAMAKMYCSDIVAIEHVHEAYRLLNASIIRVEQPDVYLDGEDQLEEEILEISKGGDEEVTDTEMDEAEKGMPETPSQKKGGGEAADVGIKMSFQEYKAITSLIMLYLRREENKLEEEGRADGIPRSQIVNWYLQEIEEHISGEEDLIHYKELTEKVIDRLIDTDNFIIRMVAKRTADGDEEEDPLLITHPNYNPEF